jgi:DNA ligase (NAD+)
MGDIEELAQRLAAYNEAYRRGVPLVSDAEYDTLVEKLREIDSNHPFLHTIEPERFEGKIEIRHPVPMLSTEKAYTKEALERFVNRAHKEARRIGIDAVRFRVTPKLDGLAGRDDGKVFVTRGNGETGYEISSAFAKGVIPIGGRGLGTGEIVVLKSYFDEHLSFEFEHPRNMVVGIIASDTVNEFAAQALLDKAVHFVPYGMLPRWEGPGDALLTQMEAIVADLMTDTDYPMDGAVAEVVDTAVRDEMGATAHHYRWQIAIKSKGETAATRVKRIVWQVGRTGNVTPVMEVSPVPLSGATIRRVTAHHAGMVLKGRIGVGTEIEIIRSGEVIPKLERVIKPSEDIRLPEVCPVCGTHLSWQNDFLKCTNPFCSAQIEQGLSHWFKTLGNADWFGIQTIRKLVSHGYDTLEKIYAMEEKDFRAIGFGPVLSRNLADALGISRSKPVEDWRFLASFGIPNLGKGDSRKLLSHMPLMELLDTEKVDIEKIAGFGGITSKAIAEGIVQRKETIRSMLRLGFNLEKTNLPGKAKHADSAIAGKGIVFTGKMLRGSREALQEEARRLGARVQSAVSGQTDYLVYGEKVGAAKITKAREMNVRILSEAEYLALIAV